MTSARETATIKEKNKQIMKHKPWPSIEAWYMGVYFPEIFLQS